MRERELGVVGLGVLEEQYIDIERARAESELAGAPMLALDALALIEEQVSGSRPVSMHTTWLRNASWSSRSWGAVS